MYYSFKSKDMFNIFTFFIFRSNTWVRRWRKGKKYGKILNGFEGLYQISNLGRVKSLKKTIKRYDGHTQSYKERILKVSNNKNKYETVILCKNHILYSKLVHRLVAEAFIANPYNKPNVDHIDTDIHNNCYTNLRWVSQKENCLNSITRMNISKSKQGHRPYLLHHTEASKLKMSLAKKGIIFIEEHKRHLSEAHKKKGDKYEITKSNL